MNLRLLKDSGNPDTCATCGRAVTYVDAKGDAVTDPPGTLSQVSAYLRGLKRVGHEACLAEEQERWKLAAEAAEEERAFEVRREARSGIALAMDWPPERAEELDFGTVQVPRLRAWGPGLPGLLICGRPGVGKSHALRAFGLSIFDRFGIRPTWMNANRWLDRLRANFDAAEHLAAAAESATVLLVDDLGAEKLTEWAEAKLERVLTRRFDFRLATFVTTNIAPETFGERFGDRIKSRLSGLCEVVHMTGPDRRRDVLAAQRKGAPTA